LTQYHNLDDSGDPGLNGSEGSSSHFALAMVQLAEHAPLSQLATVRQALHLSPLFEFKSYKTTPIQKDVFFKAIEAIHFRVRAVVIDKSGLEEHFTEMSGQDFTVEFISRLTLRASELDIANDVLIIDGATPVLCRALRVRLSAECRQRHRVRPFKKIVGGRSASEDGLQLADMIAGAVRQHVMQVENDYYETFANKVADLWEVPGSGK